ncbi:MAG: glycosyltransferase family 1 protein [Pseudomonadota bacterium]
MKRPVLFDATRLLSRIDRRAPTGIDRVCLAYAEHLLARRDLAVTPVRSLRDQLTAVDPRWFAEVVEALRARWSGDTLRTPVEARLISALTAARRGRSLVEADQGEGRTRRGLSQLLRQRPLGDPPRNAVYINVGHTGLDSPRILGDLAERGVARVVMVHDLIPITHPEYCRPGEGARHRTRMRCTLRNASHIIVNSAATGAELAAFAGREGISAPPVQVAHLGLEPLFLSPARTPAAAPYFVHVGTLEGRKNLAFLLSVWRRLDERMGPAAPRLALIGRHGWENEAVLDHLQRSPNLQGLVHQVAELPDAGLARLLGGARGLVAPSSVEGFDLPVAEALSLGVPVIASDIPVHRELAPNARLIDPLDGPGWLTAIEAATTKAPRQAAYAAPTWAAHFEAVSAFAGL